MNPEKMKRMDSEQRLESFRLDEILNIMDIKGHETILDVGAGPGAFSIPIAKKLTSGHIFAYDVDNSTLQVLRDKIESQGITNITPILIDINARLPQRTVDKIFICTVLHEIDDKRSFISQYKELLNEHGKMYIVEFIDDKRRLGETNPPKREHISMDEAKKILKEYFSNVKIEELNELIYICVCS